MVLRIVEKIKQDIDKNYELIICLTFSSSVCRYVTLLGSIIYNNFIIID